MIRIKFAEPHTKTWKRWVTACTKASDNLKRTYKLGAPFEVSDLYKRKSIKVEVYFAKEGPFRGRCVYCEANIKDFQDGDVEHFRPKMGVTDENDLPVMIVASPGKNLQHPGYYWLAYNWTNLLPACVKCNRPGPDGIGKHNRFPLAERSYATSEEGIPQEKPLLINPLDPKDDDPEDHIGVDLKTGLLTYKNNSKRAEMCVKIFGLNKRDQLVDERRTAINEVKAKWVELAFSSPEAVADVRRELDKMVQGNLSHTLARRAQFQELKNRYGL